MFARWNQEKVSHVVSMVLFSRLYFPIPPPDPGVALPRDASSTLAWDAHGRCYHDFYKVVTDWESRTEWASVLEGLRQECHIYREQLFDRFQLTGPDGKPVRPTANSRASEGNFLEATNLALNVFEKVHALARAKPTLEPIPRRLNQRWPHPHSRTSTVT